MSNGGFNDLQVEAVGRGEGNIISEIYKSIQRNMY